jgi:hypothetical protein
MPLLFRQEGCLLYFSENGEVGPWQLAANLENCSPTELPINDPQRICAGAVGLSEWLINFLAHNVGQVQNVTTITRNVVEACLSFFSDIPGLGPLSEALQELLGVDLSNDLTNPFYQSNVGRALYCRIIKNSKFDEKTFVDWLQNLPSGVASYHLSNLAHAITFEKCLSRFELYIQDISNVCSQWAECDSNNLLIPIYPDTFLQNLGNNKYRIYYGNNNNITNLAQVACKLPYHFSCYKLNIVNSSTNLPFPGIRNNATALITNCNGETVEFNTLSAINGVCFNKFELFSADPIDFTIEITNDIACSPVIVDDESILYIRQPITGEEIQLHSINHPTGGKQYTLNGLGLSSPVNADADGYYRYYLKKLSYCQNLRIETIVGNVPETIRLWGCDNTFQQINFSNVLSNTNGICFNAFALPKGHYLKILLSSCVSEQQTWCVRYTFDNSSQGWSVVGNYGTPQLTQGQGQFVGTDVTENISGSTFTSKRLYLFKDLAASAIITKVDLLLNYTKGILPTETIWTLAANRGSSETPPDYNVNTAAYTSQTLANTNGDKIISIPYNDVVRSSIRFDIRASRMPGAGSPGGSITLKELTVYGKGNMPANHGGEVCWEWCHTFDFLLSNGGFVPISTNNPYNRNLGEWISNTGWRYTDVFGNAEIVGTVYRRGVYIEKSFTATTITRIICNRQYTLGGFTPSEGYSKYQIEDQTGVLVGGLSQQTNPPAPIEWIGSKSMSKVKVLLTSAPAKIPTSMMAMLSFSPSKFVA